MVRNNFNYKRLENESQIENGQKDSQLIASGIMLKETAESGLDL